MNQYVIGATLVALASGCSMQAQTVKTAAPQSVAPVAASAVATTASGIDMKNFDSAVRAQDDFYRHVNGAWLEKTEIPADKSGWGAFYELREETLPQLRAIIEDTLKGAGTANSEAQKISGLYASFMDEQKLDANGLKPLAAEFAAIASIRNKRQIPALIANFNRFGATAPYDIGIHQDAKDATRYIVDLGQGGLGLPDRDYYLKDDDARLKEARVQYQAHIEKMLAMAGDRNAAASARNILALETALARVQWTKVENRDPVKTYNRVELAKLDALAPGYYWKSYLRAAGIDGKISYVVVSQPSYFTGFAKVLQTTPLEVWKTYFKWHLLSSYAPYLSKTYDQQHFAFYGTTLRGIPQQEPRWKRGIRLVEHAIGEGLGKLYVERHFPPAHKARMEKLVANLLEAYRQSIDTLDWMSPATKKEAQAKLATFMPKIGYPNKWRDYSALSVNKDDLVGNVRRANAFEYQRNINKLGKPIDREEWGMTPQTVNAYYNPELNEIVFPAAILQPPFFNAQADDAVNYGGIGAVIGHEISHGFDDQGSQYDGLGNLRDWWSKEDHEKFNAKTAALIKQYDAYSPLPGYHVNGNLTLGENIADNSGLAIAYKAYQLSLAGKKAPLIDGFSGNQRFFTGFAQVWRGKVRDQETVVRIKTDPHSPPEFRSNGTLRNQPSFYDAFGVKPDDKMYLAPENRVQIW
ncbi:MAG TPA: M13-type metalloendopeptidase [Burkholderiaceae bacterium]|nr:M13-type metalloendopeptidase [Burkholderiaceae bacterium]